MILYVYICTYICMSRISLGRVQVPKVSSGRFLSENSSKVTTKPPELRLSFTRDPRQTGFVIFLFFVQSSFTRVCTFCFNFSRQSSLCSNFYYEKYTYHLNYILFKKYIKFSCNVKRQVKVMRK